MIVVVRFSNGAMSGVRPEQVKIINDKCYAPSGMCTMSLCEILFYAVD